MSDRRICIFDIDGVLNYYPDCYILGGRVWWGLSYVEIVLVLSRFFISYAT